MNKERAKGILKVIVMKMKEGVGLMVGNRKQRFKDASSQGQGNERIAYGNAKEAAPNQAKHI